MIQLAPCGQIRHFWIADEMTDFVFVTYCSDRYRESVVGNPWSLDLGIPPKKHDMTVTKPRVGVADNVDG